MQPPAPTTSAGAAQGLEWPTLAVTAAVYGGLGVLTWYHTLVPVWLLPLLGGYFVCWHGSLQHETVHGHPTPWSWMNRALVTLPVSLWMPYERYRQIHLAHHKTPALTVPGQDPESFYFTRDDWGRLPRALRVVLAANNTLLGRLTLGPLLAVGTFFFQEARELSLPGRAGVWARHWLGVGVVLVWVQGICGMPVWLYLLAFAWPGLSLTLLRSFHEHQPAEDPTHRTVNVRGPALLRLVYLNNNFHVAHHAEPRLPWYELPRREPVTDWQTGYGKLAARSWRRKDTPVHPFA